MHFFGSCLHFFSRLFCLCACLSGCMVGPDFHTPKSPEAKGYTYRKLTTKTQSTPRIGPSGKSQHIVSGGEVSAEWWTLFRSRELNELMARGIDNSPNLIAAKAALRQAAELWCAQIGSTLYPSVSAQINLTRQAFSNTTFGQSGSAIFNLFNPAFNISYTLDVFGGLKRQIENLAAQVDYQAFQLEAAYLSLTSNIATTAINLASFREQIIATEQLIQSQEKTLGIIRKQAQLGGASGADALAQETKVAQLRATLPPLQQSYDQALHLLAILIGSFPSEVQLPNFTLAKLHLPAKLPLSLPSSLARQRPDIRASEALLHAASAQVGVATANLYPQLTLRGSYGWQNESLANTFADANSVWSIAGSLLQPLYNAGALNARKRAAIAAFDQAFAQYRQVVLQAFRNVADTLRALDNDAQLLRAQKDAEDAAFKTLRMNQRQLKLGGVSYLNLLNAQTQYQQSQLGRIKAQAARYNDTVALFTALGGGWWNKNALAAKSWKGAESG